MLVSRSLASENANGSQRAFASASASIASTLNLGSRREQDLVLSAAGFFLQPPDASSAQFRAWSRSIQAMQRLPELDGWGEVVPLEADAVEAQILAPGAARVDAARAAERMLGPKRP